MVYSRRRMYYDIVLQTFRCTSDLELDDWICVPHFQWFIPGRITAAILSFLVLTLSNVLFCRKFILLSFQKRMKTMETKTIM